MSYFDRDARALVSRAQASPEAFFWIAIFVVLTIRQTFYLMPMQMADVRQHGVTSRFLFGWKRDAFRFLAEHKGRLQGKARECYAGKLPLDSLILEYLAIPGLGIVKASFLAQMTVGQGACLDSHNLKALGLAESAFKTPKTLKVETIARHIAAYRAIWQAEGDSESWWDRWCDHVATLYPKRFTSGADVSALHRLPIEGEA